MAHRNALFVTFKNKEYIVSSSLSEYCVDTFAKMQLNIVRHINLNDVPFNS